MTHIDAVPDNFLFVNTDGKEDIRLIDWEYAGMQDPHVDIAMFCIYAMYDSEQIDNAIDIYFEGNCDDATRLKIYSYIAVCFGAIGANINVVWVWISGSIRLCNIDLQKCIRKKY